MSDYRVRTDCRLCGGDLERSLDLGETPLGNELLSTAEESLNQERFPLYLSTCVDCRHVQLPVVVDPSRLFRSYPYLSGTSPVFRDHLRRQEVDLVKKYALQPGDLVVEIGSNDGTLLRYFDDLGMRAVGVDPAENLAHQANASGLTTIPDFFTSRLAHIIRKTWGPAKLVVANNVFAHADDLGDIADGVKILIEGGGRFVFEVGYLPDVVARGQFDVIYHEHLSYHHLAPLSGFFGRRGMHLRDAERVDSQGGSIRVEVVCDPPPSPRSYEVTQGLADLFEEEREAGEFCVSLEPLARKISTLRDRLVGISEDHKGLLEGRSCAAFGAPAKAATMFAVLGITRDHIRFVVEENPLKVGKFLPGTGIPIVSMDEKRSIGNRFPIDAILVSAWNFAADIIERHDGRTFSGVDWIVPLPTLEVL